MEYIISSTEVFSIFFYSFSSLSKFKLINTWCSIENLSLIDAECKFCKVFSIPILWRPLGLSSLSWILRSLPPPHTLRMPSWCTFSWVPSAQDRIPDQRQSRRRSRHSGHASIYHSDLKIDSINIFLLTFLTQFSKSPHLWSVRAHSRPSRPG